MRKGLLVFILLFYVLSLAGCATLFKREDAAAGPTGLEPQLSMKFTDIPSPSGFKFLYKHSYAFQSGNVRMAVLRYSGRKYADEVVNFYKQQMPLYNWDLVNSVEYGTRLLNFERDDESCIITIQPKTFSTLLTVTLGPKRPISRAAEKPVK